MSNIFDSKKDFVLFKDERVLYPDFVPEQLAFREEQLSELVFCLKPASIGRKPINVFVHGPPGAGKTVTLKYVLNELGEYSDRVKGIYVNCFEFSSKQAILSKIANSLGVAVPNRGVSSQDVFLRIISFLRTKKIVPLIVFDEAEQLLRDDSTKSLVYDLSRFLEQHKVMVGLVFISNDTLFLNQLDDRTKSSLQCSVIPFEPYNVIELKEIIFSRTKYAFFSDSLSEEVVPLCAVHSFRLGGDLRVAFGVLLRAARLAQRKNSKQVLEEHVRASFSEKKLVKSEITSNLNSQESDLLDFLSTKKNFSAESKELYAEFKEKYSERTIRYAISSLEEKKLVECTKLKKDKNVTRLIKKIN